MGERKDCLTPCSQAFFPWNPFQTPSQQAVTISGALDIICVVDEIIFSSSPTTKHACVPFLRDDCIINSVWLQAFHVLKKL